MNASTCKWEHVSEFQENGIKYDIQLVNGNPVHANKNIFKYQFSSDKQDLLQVYLGLLILYTILMPLQMRAALKQSKSCQFCILSVRHLTLSSCFLRLRQS